MGLFLLLALCDSGAPSTRLIGVISRGGPAFSEYFIYFNGLRKRRKMLGSSEAKRRLSLQTIYVMGAWGGPDEAGSIPVRGGGGGVSSGAAPVSCE